MYAKINRNLTDTGERRVLDPANVPAASDLAPNKPYWVPVVDVVNDTSTGEDVVSWVVEEVQIDRLVRTTTIRDKTEQEIDAEDDAILDGATAGGITRALLFTMFQLANDVRALEGQPAMQFGEFVSSLKLNMRP